MLRGLSLVFPSPLNSAVELSTLEGRVEQNSSPDHLQLDSHRTSLRVFCMFAKLNVDLLSYLNYFPVN